MDPVSSATVPAEPRQRWRVVFRRRSDAPPLAQREQLAAWEAALARGELRLAGLDLPAPRPRIVFGAPLGAGIAAERELLDLFLVERLTVAEARRRLLGSLPAGHELVDLHDVWLPAPPLSGQVAAADYRLEIELEDGSAPDPVRLSAACARLLGAATLPRTREKGGRPISYDLRPLVADIRIRSTPPGGPPALIARTRFHPERGVGRPEEVLAVLSELAGLPFVARLIVRERLVLAEDA